MRIKFKSILICASIVLPTISFAQNATQDAVTKTANEATATIAQIAKSTSSSANEYFEKQMAGALKGDTTDMVGVAMAYEEGDGVAKDTQKALFWYEKAAQLNDVEALDDLGNIYLDGEYVERDEAKGFAYKLRCAKLGGSYCALYVANSYYYGDIVEKNLGEAENFYLKASKVKGYLWVHAHGMKDPQIYAADALEEHFNYKCRIRGQDYNRYYVCRKHK